MGFIKDTADAFKRGLEDDHRYTIADQAVTCSHCGGQDFERARYQLNTAGLTFLGLDWANQDATVLVCKTCGHLEWFLEC